MIFNISETNSGGGGGQYSIGCRDRDKLGLPTSANSGDTVTLEILQNLTVVSMIAVGNPKANTGDILDEGNRRGWKVGNTLTFTMPSEDVWAWIH